MSREQSPATRRFTSAGMTVLGIVLAAIPPALWIAWTRFGFLVVLAVGLASAVLFIVLMEYFRPPDDDALARHDGATRAVIPDEFVEEIHQISPLTYHHSRFQKARFRRTMNRLRTLMR